MDPQLSTQCAIARKGEAWFLTMLFIANFPLAFMLPARASWENGWIEKVQAVVLLAGFCHAAWVWARINRRHATLFDDGIALMRLGLIAMPIWLMCFGRETSWGATFMTQASVRPDGPFFSSRDLWYHAAIKPMVLISTVGIALTFLYWRLDRILKKVLQHRRFPRLALVLTLLAGVISTVAEGHIHVDLPDSESMRMMFEELNELTCYLGLVLIQRKIFSFLMNNQTN